MRFSIAHEVGHYVMHQELYKQFRIGSIKDYIDFVLSMNEGTYRSVEFQANWFAAVLLTPPDCTPYRVCESQGRLKANDTRRLSERSRAFTALDRSDGREEVWRFRRDDRATGLERSGYQEQKSNHHKKDLRTLPGSKVFRPNTPGHL